MEQDPEKRKEHYETLSKTLTELNEELKKLSPGPYVCGQEFTVADIALYPFFERSDAVLGHFRKEDFTFLGDESLDRLKLWYNAVSNRPSVAYTNRTRHPQSIATQPFGAKGRREYLQEVYAAYALNKVAAAKALIKDAPPGVTTVTYDDLKNA